MKKLFVLFMLSLSFMRAQDTLRGPHNGAVAIAGDYRIEALGCNEYLEIYLYDKFMEPMLNAQMSGNVKYYRGKEAGTSEALVRYGNDGYTAKFPAYTFTTYKVTLVVLGVPYSATFKNECRIPK